PDRRFAEARDVTAIELHFLLRGDDLFDDARQSLEHVRRSVEGHVEIEEHTALLHAPEVAQAALEEITVADDDLLAIHAADAGGFQPNVLDGARHLIDANRVTDVEWLVEHDRQRGEQIAEDVLHGKRDRDAADAKSGDQRRNLDAEDGFERREK